MSTQFNCQIHFYFKQFSLIKDLFQSIQFSIRIVFVSTWVNVKSVVFQVIQFSISKQFSSIWYIDRTLSSATSFGQSGPGSDRNEGVLLIPQSTSITGTSLSDCFVSYPGYSLRVVLFPCRGAFGVFYGSNQQSKACLEFKLAYH